MEVFTINYIILAFQMNYVTVYFQKSKPMDIKFLNYIYNLNLNNIFLKYYKLEKQNTK